MAKHPGFAAIQANIAKKEGVPKKAAGAILASATRKASPVAKAANPALKKVAMPAAPVPPMAPGFKKGGMVKGSRGC